MPSHAVLGFALSATSTDRHQHPGPAGYPPHRIQPTVRLYAGTHLPRGCAVVELLGLLGYLGYLGYLGSHTLVWLGGLPGRMADTSASVLDGRDRLCEPLPEVRWQRGQPVGCGSVAGARLLAYLRHATVPVGPSVPPSLPHRRPGLLGLARPRLSPVPSPPYSKIN